MLLSIFLDFTFACAQTTLQGLFKHHRRRRLKTMKSHKNLQKNLHRVLDLTRCFSPPATDLKLYCRVTPEDFTPYKNFHTNTSVGGWKNYSHELSRKSSSSSSSTSMFSRHFCQTHFPVRRENVEKLTTEGKLCFPQKPPFSLINVIHIKLDCCCCCCFHVQSAGWKTLGPAVMFYDCALT